MPTNNTNTTTVENLMYSTPFEGLSQYKTPYSRELEGKNFDLIFDDGFEMNLFFPFRNKVLYSENDGSSHLDICHCMKADNELYLIMWERQKSDPRSGVILVLDLRNSLVTGNFVQQGTVPEFPGLVTRTVRFGAIRNGCHPLPGNRHYFTDEMSGKKIEWTYNPDFKIIHVYLSKDSYCFAFNHEIRERLDNTRKAEGKEPLKPIIEPSIFIHIRDNIYLFSWIEENGGSGTQGLILANKDCATDVGCFFGLNPEGNPEAYMFSAYGKWINEPMPEDNLLS